MRLLALLALLTSPLLAQSSGLVGTADSRSPERRIGGLQLWLRADRGVVRNFSQLARVWRDQSGNGNHVVQNSALNKPRWDEHGLAGQPSLHFDGNDTLFRPDGMPLGSYTKVVVCSLETFDRANHLVSGDGGHAFSFGTTDRPRMFHVGNFVLSQTPAVLNTPIVLVATFDEVTGTAEIYQDGVLTATSTLPLHGDPALRIGGYLAGGFLGGSIGEVMVYDRVLGSSEREYVEQQLAARYDPLTAPAIAFSSLPRHGQVFQRDAQDTSAVLISGSIDSDNFDDIEVEVRRNEQLETTITQPLAYLGGTAFFAITASFQAGLDDYDLEVWVRDGGTRKRVAHRANLACGDLLLINGQSNAVAGDFNLEGLANQGQSRWVRSYGTGNADPTREPTDRHWDRADGENWSDHSSVGQWALELGQLLVAENQVPVGILNGAINGTVIAAHQRNDIEPTDLNSIYGRLLNRAQLAGCADSVRYLIWYQGESDSGAAAAGYQAWFQELYDDWFTDYTALEQVYVVQVRSGCGNDRVDDGIREVLRNLPLSFPLVQTVSTTAIAGHDGCHFFHAGYKLLAERLLPLIQRDLFGSPDTQEIDPPNLDFAQWASVNKDMLLLSFQDPDDVLVFEAGTELDMVLDDGTAVTSGTVNGNTVLLTLAGPSTATNISYVGHVFDGPFLRNDRGVGALTFFYQTILP